MIYEIFCILRSFILSQEEYSPEDPANPCVNYPTEEYESYADCDDHFVRSFLPPGLKPFWTVDNISEATDTFYLEYDLLAKTLVNLGIYVAFQYIDNHSKSIKIIINPFKPTYSPG